MFEEAILATGATLLYLPPYSPDFNPIEKFFSKLKALLRKAAKRSIDALWKEIGDLLNAVTPERVLKLLRLMRICKHLNRKRSSVGNRDSLLPRPSLDWQQAMSSQEHIRRRSPSISIALMILSIASSRSNLALKRKISTADSLVLLAI